VHERVLRQALSVASSQNSGPKTEAVLQELLNKELRRQGKKVP
jgi:hypothetical protein